MKKLLPIIALFLSFSTFAQTDLIISEYVEGWSNNKALEIYNPTDATIQLNAYRVTRYSNGSSEPPAEANWAIALPTFTLDAYKSYVIVLDKQDAAGEGQEAPVWSQLAERADVFLCPNYTISKAMYFNGNDAVALEKTDGTLVDLFARWGIPAPKPAAMVNSEDKVECWTDTNPYFSGDGIGITADHTMIKKSSIVAGVVSNPSIWEPLAEWDTLPANTFSNLGWHKSDVAPANATPVFGEASYSYILPGTVANGLLVGTMLATDAEGDVLKHFINDGNAVYVTDVRHEPFALDISTGALTVEDNVGINPAEKNLIALSLLAHDGYSQTSGLDVFVAITDSPDTLALLGGIVVNDDYVEGFYPFEKSYDVVLSSTDIPVLEATAINPDATVDITQATVVPGSATVKVTSKDESVEETYTVNFTSAVGVFTKANSNTSISLYPNPAVNNSFTVKANQNVQTVIVTNSIGQQVYVQKNVNNSTFPVSINDIPKGIYLVCLTMEDNSVSAKKIIFN